MVKSTQKIAIMYGGRSSEHDATRKSFEYLYERIRQKGLKYNLRVSYIVYITKDGRAITSQYNSAKEAVHYENITKENLTSLIDAFKLLIDNNCFVYTILYGQNGEDGRIQGVADFFSMKTNSGGIISCALGMSKYHLNQYVKSNFPGLTIPETVSLKNTLDIRRKLDRFKNREIVVKPNSLGSSVMTEKFLYQERCLPKIEKLIHSILQYDVRVLIQEYISGTEYSCGCLEKNGKIIKLPAIRIETPGNFFGQKEKFIAGYSKEIITDKTSETSQIKKMKNLAKEIFVDLDFQNAARFDFIITDKNIYFLEANPLPGVLRGSILTKMLRTKGWDVENLIEITFNNREARRQLDTKFKFEINV